jgi:hypothetical protein
MKIASKLILISCFIITLIGCDNKTKFDRTQQFNEYSSVMEYAPYSRHIKKQTINTYEDDSLISTMTIYGDEKGRKTSITLQDINSQSLSFNQKVDYDKLKFNVEYPLFFISIKDGDVILDKQGRIIKMLSQDGKTSLLDNYNNNQLTSTLISSPTINMESNFRWKNNLLVHITSNTVIGSELQSLSNKTSFTYDTDGKITQSESRTESESDKRINEIEITYVASYHDWNEYGDWTTATGILKYGNEGNTKTRAVREIEYW